MAKSPNKKRVFNSPSFVRTDVLTGHFASDYQVTYIVSKKSRYDFVQAQAQAKQVEKALEQMKRELAFVWNHATTIQ